MRATLNALTEELKRLKSVGVRHVAVSADTVIRLKSAVERQVVSQAAVTPEQNSLPPLAAAAPQAVRSSPAPKVTLPTTPSFTLPEGDKQSRWTGLRDIVLGDPICRANVRAGKKVVFGIGSLDASVLFVGEAPGAEEERQGEPFVGPAGQLLTKMIAGMGLARAQVYICNIMNWRPQMPTEANGEQFGNRPPTPEEMAYCLPYLQAQIEVVAPKVVVALGATAAHGLLGHAAFKSLGDIRGRWHEFAGLPLMVTYHPSYILRNQSNRSKRMIWEDLLKVMERMELPISPKQRSYFLER